MRLLILTHTFLPSQHPNAKRPYYVARGFVEAGWAVDVVTSPLGMAPGAEECFVHPASRVFRLSNPTERLRRAFAAQSRLVRPVLLAVSAVMWPDDFVIWSVKALRTVRRLGVYDRVVVNIIPPSLLLGGLRAQLVGPHWAFDYQESVTPFLRLQPRRSPLPRLLGPVLRRLEQRTLHKAGRVIFTAETNRQAYVREGLAPAAATVHVPYFYDANLFRPTGDAGGDRFEIAYFGTFDWRGNRSPETFLRALARFLEQHPEARPHTRFSFYGPWLPEHNRYLDELRLRDVVVLHPALAYDAYVSRLKQSPVLLLVVSAAHNLFMPSKIVDYFGARRPILAFVPAEAEMRRVLEDAGMAEFACDPGDPRQGSVALGKLWQRYRTGVLGCDAKRTQFWSSEVQIPRYLKAVTELPGLAQARGVSP